MTATTKRGFGALLIAMLCAFAVSWFSPTAANADGSAPKPGSSGTVGVLGEHFVKYCLKGFKPNSPVTVTNETTGQSITVHTDSHGAGCAQVPVKRACKAMTDQIVATGTGASGNPASVRTTINVPATPSLCSSSEGSTLPFTGSNIIIPGAIIGLVLIATGTALTVVRRRRADGLAV